MCACGALQILGAGLGALSGAAALPPGMIGGLKNRAEIAAEIDAFVAAVFGPSTD
jgi:hypothetical protein